MTLGIPFVAIANHLKGGVVREAFRSTGSCINFTVVPVTSMRELRLTLEIAQWVILTSIGFELRSTTNDDDATEIETALQVLVGAKIINARVGEYCLELAFSSDSSLVAMVRIDRDYSRLSNWFLLQGEKELLDLNSSGQVSVA